MITESTVVPGEGLGITESTVIPGEGLVITESTVVPGEGFKDDHRICSYSW